MLASAALIRSCRKFGLSLVGLLTVTCGGSGAKVAQPTPVATPDTGFPVGTVLSFVSGATNAPLAGASLTAAGTVYVSDAQGQVRLTQRLERQGLIDIVAPGILDRQTLVRSSATTRFSVWPRTGVGGFDENYTASLVYTEAAEGSPVGEKPLRRIRSSETRAVVVLSPELRGDPEIVAAHQAAVDRLNNAVRGQIVYALANEAPASGVVFTATLDPSDPDCTARVRGFFSGRTQAGELTSGRIVYCFDAAARSPTVTHELGHSFGLGHSPLLPDLMYRTFERQRGDDFSAREALAMNLMLLRRGGNRFPDNDREVGGAGAGSFTTVCR